MKFHIKILKKSYFQVFVINLGLIVYIVTNTVQGSDQEEKIPPQCRSGCATEYGAELGTSPLGVTAYSNCNAECVIFEPHQLKGIYTGIKWQCVEYARRWLLKHKAVVFGDVDVAADIWSLQQVYNPINKKMFEFNSIVNGASALPEKGDLLIYGQDYLDTGHVAVVIGIDEKLNVLQVAEQNYENKRWQNTHAREIAYTKFNDQYWLLDPYLVGWKRVIIN